VIAKKISEKLFGILFATPCICMMCGWPFHVWAVLCMAQLLYIACDVYDVYVMWLSGIVWWSADQCHRCSVHAGRMWQSVVFGVVTKGQRVVLCSHSSCTDAGRCQSRHYVFNL